MNLDKDPALAAIWSEAREKMKGDPGHDPAHLLRVAEWTLKFGEGKLDEREAIASALLHDIVNVPKNSPDRARASELSADYARECLARHGFSAASIDAVATAIRSHSFSRGERPSTRLGQSLQDADRLEALGAIGIFRLISTGTLMGGQYFDPSDPWARERELDDKKFSVDHFFTKLFKLPALMNTPAGKAEAERRAGVMRELLAQLGQELGVPWDPRAIGR